MKLHAVSVKSKATISQCVDQSVCRSVTNLATIRTDTVNEEPFLGTIEIISTHSKDNQWMIELLLNGKPVQFKIDTGADVTAISEEYSSNWMESLSKKQVDLSMVQPSKHQLIMHGQFIGLLTSTIKHVSRDFRSSIVATRESVSVDKEHSK